MMSCLSASRTYRFDGSCNNGASSQASTSSIISDSKSTISSAGSEISSALMVSRKKPRTRRKRPQEVYNEAAAALSAMYPKIFTNKVCTSLQKRLPKFGSCTREKIENWRYGEEAELLHEVPELFSRRAAEVEGTELLHSKPPQGLNNRELECRGARRRIPNLLSDYNKGSPVSSESKSQSEAPIPAASSPSWEAEFECFLGSNETDIDGGVMSSIMGSSTDPDSSQMDGSGPFGLGLNGYPEAEGNQNGLHRYAIRALRRASDCMICPIIDYSFPRLKLSDKIMAEQEMNAMSFCSFDWLKKDDPQQKLSLKLNYEDVMIAWSDRGSLYTDETQTVPDDSSSSEAMATGLQFDFIPDMGSWRNVDENGIHRAAVEDRSSAGEDRMVNGSGLREASVLRYKEKRRTRLFSKKIRYEVRKINAERRPRMKGRFVRSPAEY